MLTKRMKKAFAKEVNNLINETSQANTFHNRIHDEIQESKRLMKERRDKFKIIQNK